MIYILFKMVVCLFALYGMIMLGLTTFVRGRGKGHQKIPEQVADHMKYQPVYSGPVTDRDSCPLIPPAVRMVLLVKDAQEQIEYIVRTAVKNDFASRVLSDNSIVIIDMNSTDETLLLLEKLQKDFSNIDVFRFEDREIVFEEFKLFSHPPK